MMTHRPTTYASYEMIIRVHIKPEIGNIMISDLRTDNLQKLYKEKQSNGKNAGSGLSPKTLRNIHNVLHEALDQAVKNRKQCSRVR